MTVLFALALVITTLCYVFIGWPTFGYLAFGFGSLFVLAMVRAIWTSERESSGGAHRS